jgi:oligopeptide/dipeptide ABC transporter ATP-binding protein
VLASESSAREDVLDVRGLNIYFETTSGPLQAVSDLSFSISAGEMVGLVGESGSGKSVTALSLMGLLPRHASHVTGEVRLAGRQLIGLDDDELAHIRGRDMSMIFQEPMTALDPVFKVGFQIAETLRAHERMSRKAASSRAVELLTAVGIPDPARRANSYPHQLSGGMRQRVMIAIAIAAGPSLLIADEPTTALDVTIQAQILDVLKDLSAERGTAVLLITHNLGVVAETCRRVLTMYAGQLVESATVEEALLRPAHPYTFGLLGSMPTTARRKSLLPTIPGRVPQLSAMPAGCRFQPRCPMAIDACSEPQLLRPLGPDGARSVRCCRAEELHLMQALARDSV